MKKYNVYGMGAALVDTEIEVDDAFLGSAGIDKGVMTLVDEARQDRLLDLLGTHLVASRRASGGSAAHSMIKKVQPRTIDAPTKKPPEGGSSIPGSTQGGAAERGQAARRRLQASQQAGWGTHAEAWSDVWCRTAAR